VFRLEETLVTARGRRARVYGQEVLARPIPQRFASSSTLLPTRIDTLASETLRILPGSRRIIRTDRVPLLLAADRHT
jgi:hypothetical protein